MSIFNYRHNFGDADVSSSRHFLNALANGADPDLIIWKSPVEDFNTNSVLTVNPGEEALFYKNGQLMQVFGPGRYELKTENYPFLSALRNILSGGESTFTCQVFFVRTAMSMEILWGTDSPIQVRDPVQQIQTSLTGRGAYKITIADAPLFISKLAGFVEEFHVKNLDDFFFHQFLQTIKSSIAKALMQAQEEILGVCAKLDDLAAVIGSLLQPVFASYGLKLAVFNINALDIAEDDPNRAELEAAYRRKRELALLGSDYERIKSMEIMKDVANNQGAGGDMSAAGAGLGMGFAVSGMMSKFSGNLFGAGAAPAANPAAAAPADDPAAKLAKLKTMLEAGLITQDDYDNTKKQILAAMLQ